MAASSPLDIAVQAKGALSRRSQTSTPRSVFDTILPTHGSSDLLVDSAS